MNSSPAASPVVFSLQDGPSYEWSEPWNHWLAARPRSEMLEWIHSGIAVTRSGDVIVISHDRAEAHVLGADGTARRSFRTGVVQGHGLLIAEENDEEVVWIADNGTRRQRASDGTYANISSPERARAVKMSLAGEHLLTIPAPDLGAYSSGKFAPTSIAVAEAVYGGNGDVWVADGYGQSLVHRFRSDGTYLMSLSGQEGAGRFACPHAIWIDRRRGEPELLVSDRKNHRVQIFDLDGNYKRAVGNESVFRLPGGFAAVGEFLVVAELRARLAVLGPDDTLLGYLGGDDIAAARDGFPNELDHAGHPVRPGRLRPGCFNSPHGLAADRAGNLYVSEFLIGGRLVKLTRLS
jgi:hypothetical protein